ncbi:MAG: GspE/PulE family protein [Phycisphaerae bacterium]|jgi:type IV pilus assembly protein PilB
MYSEESQVLLFEPEKMMQNLADYISSVERVHLNITDKIDMRIARMLPEYIATRFCLVAVREKENRIVVAMANPLDLVAFDTVRVKLNREITIAVSSKDEILNAIEAIYHDIDMEEQQLYGLTKPEERQSLPKYDAIEAIRSEAEAMKSPVIQFVDLMLKRAVKNRASDIHIEPQANSMIIRMRIDGALRKTAIPPEEIQAAVIVRIKVLSSMNIAERRLPQDGRFKVKIKDREIDIRVATIPAKYGEKVVMRLLDQTAVKLDIEQLGFESKLLEEFKNVLSQPHGIIIVTGPAGSGKSTTLYSALNYLKNPKKNITTVEDPIEYSISEINQIQVKPEIGLDFASSLRAILRQDPDIILIGEIRDKETVDIAIQASLTGHLVLSTFHTNDAPATITRLIFMGAEPYLLSSSLNLIVAQRLIRKICEHCKSQIELPEEVVKQLKITPEQTRSAVFYRGRGCKACEGTGFLGRLPIFEFLPIDDDMRKELLNRADESQMRALANKKGYGGLFEDGISKVLQGLTTVEEVLGTVHTKGMNV